MELVLWLFQESPQFWWLIPLIFLAFSLDLLERTLMAPCSAATIIVLVWMTVLQLRKRHNAGKK
jgi:hypothetical protein